MTHDWPAPTMVPSNGIDLAVRDLGPREADVTMVLLHGFPELGYSWRHVADALVKGGLRVVVPDLRGYGRTGPCGRVEDYSMANLARDVMGMQDALQLERAVFVGHDFGGMLAWTIARDYADRARGVVSLCTPYTRRTDTDLVETMRRHRGLDNYMVTFQQAGVAEALFERELDHLFDRLMRRPRISLAEFRQLDALQSLPARLLLGDPAISGAPVLEPADIAFYTAEFRRSGFSGALNWYRNLRKNWEDGANRTDRVDIPALMLCADRDYYLPPESTRGMERIVPDLELHMVADCGHWMQQEQPETVSQLVLDWVERRIAPHVPARLDR